MPSEAERRRTVERMRSNLFYVDQYRQRANALDRLGSLLRCETPGTVSEVKVTGKRWWQRNRDRNTPWQEIKLTDDERREFRDWCEERAGKLRDRASILELEVATGAADE